ncbi:hypothetical protein AVEN_230688-1 [Araneus ventricosus]|uniref:Uncharacterized protein n=1 Tax=Araneus ventricosus TaxID=182803 RepID=A0A4Y2A2V2_ARAVE|nr:hypothetical protein AVEN_230688-1 [Araneus ventricosus]
MPDAKKLAFGEFFMGFAAATGTIISTQTAYIRLAEEGLFTCDNWHPFPSVHRRRKHVSPGARNTIFWTQQSSGESVVPAIISPTKGKSFILVEMESLCGRNHVEQPCTSACL